MRCGAPDITCFETKSTERHKRHREAQTKPGAEKAERQFCAFFLFNQTGDETSCRVDTTGGGNGKGRGQRVSTFQQQSPSNIFFFPETVESFPETSEEQLLPATHGSLSHQGGAASRPREADPLLPGRRPDGPQGAAPGRVRHRRLGGDSLHGAGDEVVAQLREADNLFFIISRFWFGFRARARTKKNAGKKGRKGVP